MKKPAASKRASVPRACDYAKSFLKDWVRLSHSGRYDMLRLKEAMLLLIANDAPLGPEWLLIRPDDVSIPVRVELVETLRQAQGERFIVHKAGSIDHALKGEWVDHRECHIGGDFLLIYQLEGNQLNFVRTGSHADLFGS